MFTECTQCKILYDAEGLGHNCTWTPKKMPTGSALIANKNDSTKLDLTLVPIEAMEGITRALTYGVQKYGRNNYRSSGMDWLRLVSACLRHLFAWTFGADTDPESGLNHIDHAQASLAMLSFQMKHHKESDNRK